MSLRERVDQLERIYKAAWEELIALKFEAAELENENRRLYAQLSILGGMEPDQVRRNGQNAQTARENLLRLYEDDFHVCHLYFGQSRRGDCLFCLACLKPSGTPLRNL